MTSAIDRASEPTDGPNKDLHLLIIHVLSAALIEDMRHFVLNVHLSMLERLSARTTPSELFIYHTRDELRRKGRTVSRGPAANTILL